MVGRTTWEESEKDRKGEEWPHQGSGRVGRGSRHLREGGRVRWASGNEVVNPHQGGIREGRNQGHSVPKFKNPELHVHRSNTLFQVP